MIEPLKIEPWGPKKLRKIFEDIVKAVNTRTPLKGLGTEVDERPDGVEIDTSEAKAAAAVAAKLAASGGGGFSTHVDIYGSFNGQPAIFHLVQTAPPTPV